MNKIIKLINVFIIDQDTMELFLFCLNINNKHLIVVPIQKCVLTF